MKTWKNRLSAVPAFIIGSAPSVELHDLTLLESYFTIGINRSYTGNTSKPSFPLDPTVLIWQDKSFWETESVVVKKSKAIKCCPINADPERICYNFTLNGGSGYSFNNIGPHVLSGRGSSGPLAVEFAYSLGCSSIVLIGLDCVTSETKQDYYGVNKFWSNHTIPNCIRGLEFLQKNCPVPIYNCGLSSFWPRITLQEAITAVDPESFWKRDREYYSKVLISV